MTPTEGAPVDVVSATRFFDAIARRYDRVYALSGATSRERMARVVGAIPARARVLDLGIGTGRELPALLDAGCDVVGLDVSVEMVAICNQRARRAPIVVGDFWAGLPFDAASFDAVVALHGTLAHPPDRAAIAGLSREIARVLRPGGVFVAEVPAPGWARGAAEARVVERGAGGAGGGGVEEPGESVVHEDRAANVAIAARAFDAPTWRALVAPALEARVEPLGDVEWFVRATRGAGMDSAPGGG